MDNKNLSFNSQAISDNQEVFIAGGQSLSGENGVKWIGQAWSLVKSKLGMWILLNIVYLTIVSVLQLIPLIGLFAGF
ncbi:hypothetical protein [Photorhabdus temperata]|uniref:Uncharacterized protein n=1 Tax=Photorhabdus temperata J3 TaxID=1389415 RepID=U7QY02_PHOTE|nr:hypothetical protein [Photorhabdus temperata]ERT12914.1 hypothetical protein O185_11545 [Photorhabdus temperata J3]